MAIAMTCAPSKARALPTWQYQEVSLQEVMRPEEFLLRGIKGLLKDSMS